MKHYSRETTIIVWQNNDGTYYSRSRKTPNVRSPIDAIDFTAYHHKAIKDLQDSMTCKKPGKYPGKWTKIKITTTASTLTHE